MLQKTLRAELTLPGIEAQLCDYSWPEHYGGEHVDSCHSLSLSVTPVPRCRARLGRMGPMQVGDLAFVPAGVPVNPIGSDAGPQTIVRCRISEAWLESFTGSPACWTETDLSACLDLKSERLRTGLERIVVEIASPGFGSAAAVESLVALSMVDVLRELGREPTRDTRASGLTRRQMKLIEERVDEVSLPLPSLAELAALIGISPRHLQRGFKQATGVTLRYHMRRKSRERAVALVAATDLSFKEIAVRLGFQRQGSFSSAFRDAEGESPREYRRRRR